MLLLDEPLGALDLKLRKQMQIELKRIQQEVGITFIYVTHDQEEAMTMSDRIAVMNKGRYEQLGDPETLYERPTTRFVAGFLGVSNLLGGDVRGRRAAATATSASRDDTMVLAPAAAVYGRTTVDVGVRPEKIRLHHDGDPTPAGPQPPRRASWRTPRTWASAPSTSSRPTAGARVMVYEQNIERTTKEELWARGDQVHLTWSPDHTFVVDARARRPPRRRSPGTRSWRRSHWWIARP